MLDYRTVEGMPHPFRTAIEVKGAMAAGGASDEQAAEAREQLAELDRQMAEMPASQREMMEKMMGTRLEQLRNMVQSGNFEIELVVTDLKVNTGPPPGSGG
jgi:roadblock/LC7 domain-containing protein